MFLFPGDGTDLGSHMDHEAAHPEWICRCSIAETGPAAAALGTGRGEDETLGCVTG